MFHGCGGMQTAIGYHMRAIADAGFLAVAPDSLAPRRISRARAVATVCTGAELPGWQRAGDVLASLWGVRRIPGADPSRLALAGWSHGGWAIMDLMTMALTRPGDAGVADPDPALRDAVKALVLAYPYCGPGALTQLRRWRVAPPAFAFVGEDDRVAHPAFCDRAFRQMRRDGVALRTWRPEGAPHAFDEGGDIMARVRHKPAIAAEARDRIVDYLRETFPA
jgi:dienelactone hydrolase